MGMHWLIQGAMGPCSRNIRRIFLFCENRFQDKLTSSGCDNAKSAAASPDQGLCPWTPTGGSAPGPRYRFWAPCSPSSPNSGSGLACMKRGAKEWKERIEGKDKGTRENGGQKRGGRAGTRKNSKPTPYFAHWFCAVLTANCTHQFSQTNRGLLIWCVCVCVSIINTCRCSITFESRVIETLFLV